MGKINIRRRRKYFEYRVEIARIDGQRKWLSKSGFKTKNEAYEAGTIAIKEYNTAGAPFKDCNMSYSDYLDYWLDNYCKTNLKYNTIQTYKILINKYIKPRIGNYKLPTITSIALTSYITNLVNEYELSKAYFKNILKVVKGSFRDACNLYGFIKYNPALTIRLPKINREQKDIKHLYTKEEIDTILKRFKDNKTFTCAFLTSCYTGMRTGEVFALTWNDIDLDNGLISIEHSIYDKPKDDLGRRFIGSTKTENGKRIINISSTLKEALVNYKEYQNQLEKIYGSDYKYYHLEDVLNEYGKTVEKRIVVNSKNKDILDLVFTNEDGTFVGTDVTKYPFKIIKKELNIDCRFYDLRGSYATKILDTGIEIRNVADILGHRNIETTENYYVSSTSQLKKKAQDLYDINNKTDVIGNIIKFNMWGAYK